MSRVTASADCPTAYIMASAICVKFAITSTVIEFDSLESAAVYAFPEQPPVVDGSLRYDFSIQILKANFCSAAAGGSGALAVIKQAYRTDVPLLLLST